MESIFYLYKTSFLNRIKKALHRPVTYVFIIFIVAYCVFLIGGLGSMVQMMKLNNSHSVAAILSGLILFMTPANYISYTKRKGLIFRTSDVHFLFSAPISPKMILFYAHAKSMLISVLLGIVFFLVGIIYFDISPGVMFGYFILSIVLENILETSVMILLYGNEVLSKNIMNIFVGLMYTMLGVFLFVGIGLFVTQGLSFQIFESYLSNTIIQCVPIIGWNIALIRLLFIGPTTLNVICSILYIVAAISLTILAWKMKCTGAYFEDAMKFAEDYQEIKEKQKKGQVSMRIGKKKKFGKATVTYKGNYAKAIFYRQLLEYKKQRFFIFGLSTLVSLAIGIGICVLSYFSNWEEGSIYILPGISAYITFIFSGYAPKWSKELDNPYTYLIPDSSIKKLWYATIIEHIRSLINGCLICVLGGMGLKLTGLQIILCILVYWCLQANKLYLSVLADSLLGNLLGNTGRTILKMLLQMLVIGIAIACAGIFGLLYGTEIGFSVMIFITVILTIAISIGAATGFERMESLN